MELGEKIRQARLAAGLSQRQLCGGHITRNMLSQIEHGTARPSMDTLRLLAAGLGKPVSYFLEEQAVTSPNQEVMAGCREAFQAGQYCEVLEALEGYRGPDPVFDREARFLEAVGRLRLGEQALDAGRLPYACRLLEQAGELGMQTPYYTRELERHRLLLMAQADAEGRRTWLAQCGEDDRELLLRAAAALEDGNPDRAGAYLDAAQDREHPRWRFLRGEVYFALGAYARAAEQYRLAEAWDPGKTAARLEVCCRELGDFRGAYEYACRQRQDAGRK